MRELFAAAGLPAPRNFRVALDADPREAADEARFPCVLKPLGLSASRGVIRANNRAQNSSPHSGASAAFSSSPKFSSFTKRPNRAIQVEEYIEGREFALEGLMTQGELEVLAIFDKPDPLEGPFFEETIYVTPSREPDAVQQAIVETTRKAVRALGLCHGPIHAEMRVNADGVYMLESRGAPDRRPLRAGAAIRRRAHAGRTGDPARDRRDAGIARAYRRQPRAS